MRKIYQQSYHFSVKNSTTPFGTCSSRFKRHECLSARERERESHVLSQTATARAHIHRQLQLPTPRPLCPLSLTRQRAISRNPWCSETLKTNASNKHPENLLKSKRKFRFVGTLGVHTEVSWIHSVNSLFFTNSEMIL